MRNDQSMKLDFKVISLEDKPRICSILEASDFQSCEYSFANNFAWRRLAEAKICLYDGFYLLRSETHGGHVYTFPAGNGDIEEIISLMKQDAEAFGEKLRLITVLKEPADRLKELYGDSITVTPDRDGFDYIYNTKRMIDLPGKKLHGKRNHIANFKKLQWEYRPLTQDMFDECIKFSALEYNDRNGYTSHSAVAEQFAINAFLGYFKELGLCGGVLYQCGRLVGFTIGERLNSNTFVIHIEKALREVQGAYPTLFNEFLKSQASGYEFVNREDDVGIEGLRRSKMSFYPDYLLEKFTVDFK